MDDNLVVKELPRNTGSRAPIECTKPGAFRTKTKQASLSNFARYSNAATGTHFHAHKNIASLQENLVALLYFSLRMCRMKPEQVH